MLKAISVSFLMLGWLVLLITRVPTGFKDEKQFYTSLLLLAIGTIISFFN